MNAHKIARLPALVLKSLSIGCLPLFLCSASGLLGTPGLEDPASTVPDPTFEVTRLLPITSRPEIYADADLGLVAAEIGDYVEELVGVHEVAKLITRLESSFGTVDQIARGEEIAYLWIIVDGIPQRICKEPVELHVAGGGLTGTVVVHTFEIVVLP